MHTAKLAASLLALLALVLGSTPARAETVNCTPITSLPAVINTQGIYCFTGDLTTANNGGAAIEIQTNNVVVDLNGYKLGGLAVGTTTVTKGIHANARQNITIKNGTVRGFLVGVDLDGPAHVVEDIRADLNTVAGISLSNCIGCVVRNNLVVTTGGSTVFVSGPNVDAQGISVNGDGVRVLNNDVSQVTKQGTGVARGILLSGTGALVVNNRVTRADRGVEFFGGSPGKYRDNLTLNVTTPFMGGTDAGNNN